VCGGIAAYGVLTALVMPLTARLHYDPSLQYMLSSLAWFRGGTYDYIDHPGTPVEVVGTVLLGLMYPLTASSPGGFIAYQLAHPQVFLSVAQTLLVATSVVVCFVFAQRAISDVTHWTQALVCAGLAGLFFVLLPDAFQSLAFWSHESFCFPAGTLLSLLVLLAVRRGGRPTWCVVLGLAAGVLTSVQVYFAAWVVGTTVALAVVTRISGATWRHTVWVGLTVAATSAVGFVVATLPIHDRYRQFGGWMRLLLTHQGTYGADPEGLPSAQLAASNFGSLVGGAPLLFGASGAVLLLLTWRLCHVRLSRASFTCHTGLLCAGLGFVAQVLVLLLMVTKHPGLKYLLPVAATLPVLAATALDGLDPKMLSTRILFGGLGLTLLAGFAAALSAAVAAHTGAVEALRRDDAATEQTLATLASQRGENRASLRTLWTYGTTSPCYALWFGDEGADDLFHEDIARVCPNDANLNVWNAEITSNESNSSLADSPDWDIVVIGQDMATINPQARPPGKAYLSATPSAGYGPLVFISNPAP
jgi:hypothetical protein